MPLLGKHGARAFLLTNHPLDHRPSSEIWPKQGVLDDDIYASTAGRYSKIEVYSIGTTYQYALKTPRQFALRNGSFSVCP